MKNLTIILMLTAIAITSACGGTTSATTSTSGNKNANVSVKSTSKTDSELINGCRADNEEDCQVYLQRTNYSSDELSNVNTSSLRGITGLRKEVAGRLVRIRETKRVAVVEYRNSTNTALSPTPTPASR